MVPLDINWVGKIPTKKEIDKTTKELQEIIDSGVKVENIVSHVVILTEDYDGPSVNVHGNTDGTFDAEYTSETKWIHYNELSDE